MKQGDVLSYSWGYDQTNVEFFEVTKATEKSVWLRPIAGKLVNGEEGFMAGRSVPVEPRVPAAHCSVTLKCPKKVQLSTWDREPKEYVRMPYGFARAWDGQPCYTSWYA